MPNKPTDPVEPYKSPSIDSKAYKQKKTLVLEGIAVMLSGYSRDDYANADLFVGQLEHVMMKYPPSVITAVTHPDTGIQRRVKYRLVLADVVEALEKEMAEFTRRALEQQGKRVQRQAIEDRTARPTREELKAKFPWLFPEPAARPTREGMLRRLGDLVGRPITQADLDAIPDASPSRKTG